MMAHSDVSASVGQYYGPSDPACSALMVRVYYQQLCDCICGFNRERAEGESWHWKYHTSR